MKAISRHKQLILASTSPYRAQSLGRLNLAFETCDPQVDEQPVEGESADSLALRLARAKANVVGVARPAAIVIGADQVGYCNGRLLTKPGSADLAIEQLLASRNQTAHFYTAVALAHKGAVLSDLVVTEMLFRDFSEAQARRYVSLDEAWDCSGSFKAEALGIALFKYIRCDDPSAIIGLPLISTVSLLAQFGVDPLA